MLYLDIPAGWSFDNKKDSDTLVFISKDLVKVIPLQYLIKECLRDKPRNVDSIEFDKKDTHGEKITLYFKRPLNLRDEFLQYEPNRNGKLKSDHVSIVRGLDIYRIKLAYAVGRIWHQCPENRGRLSPERLEQVQLESLEQRENRRHTGDSPFST